MIHAEFVWDPLAQATAPSTRSAGSEVSTSIHKASRLRSSIMFKVRKVLPLARPSLIKSSDQVWLDWAGTTKVWAVRAGNRFFGFLFKCSANSRYTLRIRLVFQEYPSFFKRTITLPCPCKRAFLFVLYTIAQNPYLFFIRG